MIRLQKIRIASMTIALSLLRSAPVFAQGPAPDAPIDVGPAIETDPAVRAALEIPRATAADHFQAIGWLIDLDRPELAKPILEELTKLQLTDDERATLVAEFGPRAMLQLARTKELAPAGAQFADACMAAAAAAANDPRRIAALVAQLADPSPEVRTIARNDLAATGQVGAIATLETLAKESDPARREEFLRAAAQMGPFVTGPLLAMLDTAAAGLRSDVAALLTELDVAQAVPLLPQPADSARRLLLDALERLQRGAPPLLPDESDRIELWHWNDATKKLNSATYSVDEARTIWMSRLARRLAGISPQNPDYLRQAVLLELEAAPLLPPAPRLPASEHLGSAETGWVVGLLAEALELNYAHAAVAAANILGERRDDDVLFTADSQPSALAAALAHPNRRVRFAALRAIMTIDPPSPYPGSSRVPEALAWFADGSGARRALVAMPTYAAASDLAGMLAAHELDAEATNRGRVAVKLARKMADLEVIFVDMDIQAPGIRQVLYELRISPTTGEIPIALVSADGRLASAERLAAEHDRVLAVPRIHSAKVLGRVVEQLAHLSGRFATPPDERRAQAIDAAAWLTKLSSGHRPFYVIRRPALMETVESHPGAIVPAPPNTQ
jgi:hypothetical protein